MPAMISVATDPRVIGSSHLHAESPGTGSAMRRRSEFSMARPLMTISDKILVQ